MKDTSVLVLKMGKPDTAAQMAAQMPDSVLKGGFKKRKAYKKPSQAQQIARLTRQVNGMIKDKEIKSFDTALNFNIDATGEIPATGQLVLIPQGAGAETRNGAKCVIKSIQIRGSLGNVPAAAATSSSTAHIYLIWDKSPNGAAAAVADVFTGTNFASAMRNITNYHRFTVLKHFYKTFTPNAGVTGAYNNEQFHWEFYKKVNIPLEFNATAGAITELTRNNIFLMCSTETASDDTIQMAGRCRVTFDDSA